MYIAGIVALYFLPYLVALGRGSIRGGGVLVVNLFLGWTVIGWVIALAWAASSDTRGARE